ncbi:MAG TPA: phage baseplate assembly protein V [Methylomirabilota bacterium]|nr:phage baseplate assembly protein V [Methylomirabilota bacterium]
MSTLEARSRSTDKRYYGVYEALVSDVNDPAQEGRVKLKMPWFDPQMVTEWCRVRQFYAGNGYGAFFVPEVGDEVLIAFIQGDMRQPIILGGLYNGNDKPATYRAADKDQKMVQTKAGHIVLLDDTSGKERVRITTQGGHELDMSDTDQKIKTTSNGGHEIELSDMDRKINVMTTGGHVITLDDIAGQITVQTSTGESVVLMPGTATVTAPSVVVSSPSVMLGGASAPFSLVLGELLLTAFNAHIHTSSIPGTPTSPPVVPLIGPMVLSQISKTS